MRDMRVIVTRPQDEARAWLDQLRARGIDAQPLPLIAIQPAPEPDALAGAWRGLAGSRAVMFVSGNAVRHFFDHRPDGMPWPQQTRAWATGPGTRQALLDAGVAPAAIDAPAADAAQFDSETLWAQVAGQVTPGDRITIVRGRDAGLHHLGRDWLADQLRAAGAKVETVVSYLRAVPDWGDEQLACARQAAEGAVWLFSSSQAVANLSSLLPGQDWSHARAVATHPRIARASRDAGFGVVCESRPSVEAVSAALESFR
jgi:uroporphyrinogen-III synthase